MTDCCITDLRDREVINICDGKRLGYVCDIEINPCDGKVVALIVPGECRLFGFGSSPCFKIPWDCVSRIGDDIILVSVQSYEHKPEEHKKKKWWCGV